MYKYGCDIEPPELMKFRRLIQKLIDVMCDREYKIIVDRWIITNSLSVNARKSISQTMFPTANREEADKWFRKVTRLLKDHTTPLREIITLLRRNEVSKIINTIEDRRNARITESQRKEREFKQIETKITNCDETGFKVMNKF